MFSSRAGRRRTPSPSTKIGVLCPSVLPTTTLMRSGSSGRAGSYPHSRKRGTLTKTCGSSRISGSHRSRSRASSICRTRAAAGTLGAPRSSPPRGRRPARGRAGPGSASPRPRARRLGRGVPCGSRARAPGAAVGQVAESAQPGGEGGGAGPRPARLDLLLPRGEGRHGFGGSGRRQRAVVGQGPDEPPVDRELGLGGGDGGGQVARVAGGAERRREVEALGRSRRSRSRRAAGRRGPRAPTAGGASRRRR